ncbi:putative E3 ubiquitin-protein ligase RNF217 [Heracleum sosnowskyi]|uniref:RBR-type E3 ubiquitin transferase n=1 Tax=Heracleum sosnowskyi TaxID=360622 RepID=A0AAD8HGH2_9APIA|nr:putative E3 ubiquitin-protein ligase RNF217 [Heracleum sosnowskyi]
MEKVTLSSLHALYSKGKNKSVEKIKLIRRRTLAIPAMLRQKSTPWMKPRLTNMREQQTSMSKKLRVPGNFIQKLKSVHCPLVAHCHQHTSILKEKVMLGSLLCALKINCLDLPEFDDPGNASPQLNTVDEAGIEEPETAEDMHIEKDPRASELDSEIEIASSSTNPSEILCEICMEYRETWQMFINSTCSHSFCYDCTRQYIETKVQDRVNIVTCPAVKCSTAIDSGACRWMLSEDIIIRWDESLCTSLIEESQKLYCPYRDCSMLLLNDSGEYIAETNCPVCQRSFCARCQVPWHSEFTCQEFVKLNRKKKRGDHLMVKKIAKKQNWRKCPSCKFYIEKTEGCDHITCRCSYEFCYRCGSEWSEEHVCF